MEDKSNKSQTRFDINLAFSNIKDQIDKNSEEQTRLYQNLIQNVKLNGRQKLKHYKKILQSQQKDNLRAQKQFINKYLKKIFLQEYLIGNTQGKPALVCLLKRLQLITFNDIIATINQVKVQNFQQIKLCSQIIDLVFRVFEQKSSKQQFIQIQPILNVLHNEVFIGQEMICKNEFKSKWLGTYNEILRTENLLVRVFHQLISKQQRDKIIQSCRLMIGKISLLSKQVVSQTFLLLLFLNPTQPEPSSQNHAGLINFYHAQSIILHKNTLIQLVALIPKLKQTQHKCQLMPILQQSFMQHYKHLSIQKQEQKQFKANVFDQVINVFEVGRSIYTYLQAIVKVIIESGDHWNMEGNAIRKFFIATIVLKIMPSHRIIQQWPTVIEDLIVQCGNISVPYAADCAKLLFEKIYQENGKNYKKWSAFWIKSYKQKLLNPKNKGNIRGIIQFINPILLKVCPKPFLLRDLLNLSEQSPNCSNLQLGVISLITCFKQMGQIQVNQKEQLFQHIQFKQIKFTYNKVRNLLLSNDQMIAVQALELISTSLKPSEYVKPMELRLCLQFFKYSIKTSMPEYRKNYLGVTKKLFDRLRNIYDGVLVGGQNERKTNKKLYVHQFVSFLKQLVQICFKNVFPDAMFELVNPALEILQLLQTYFGNRQIQVKKGIILNPTSILKQTSFYDFRNFQNLMSCLQSSYESVRKLAHDLLNFYRQIENKQLLLDLWHKSLENTNKLAIRSYQYACRVLTFISQVYPDILNIQKKYSLNQLNVLNYFLKLTEQRYLVFKDEFNKQGVNYYKNLVHGLLTVFSYSIDRISEGVSNQNKYKHKYQLYSSQIKSFLVDFFNLIINMLNFAVQISSSNVSTVVLDTLTQGSQTDKKLKVDCRGHFLTENNQKTTNVGTFLQSTALISSMEDDQQGIQNTLVVSFYLLTRQAGLVFQSVGGLLSNKFSSEYIPSENLIKLINTYFYALINLRHMGSVDRISKGLGKMARVMFDHESKQLSELPEILLDKLLNHLKEGNFTTILRRSAGVPFAFCCLLKSQSLKRNKLIEKTVTSLLELSKENSQNHIDLRIHALNILKKLFQDSDLKGDIEPYVSQAFISSIKGFTSEQWGVRNSSLMLFSTLANRTVGIKPTFNLLQFFIKCPALLQFIEKELNSFTTASLNTMYPPLYPIVLLFSRLLPFDLKQKSKIIPHNNMKHIRKEQLLSLLPILDKSGLNNNYMGRVMTAKAVLPFMQIDQIHTYCMQGMIDLVSSFNKENNMLHYQITKYNHLLVSYMEICKNSMKQVDVSENNLNKLMNFIQLHISSIGELNCPVVLQGFIKIFHYYFENFNQKIVQVFGQKYEIIVDKILAVLNNLADKYVFETQRLVINGDLGHSMMRKQAVSLQLDLLIKYTNRFGQFKKLAVKFTQFLSQKLSQNQIFFQTSDNQICEFYFQRILENVQILKQNQKMELSKAITELLTKLNLNEIRSDIILSKVLELRVQFKYITQKDKPQDQDQYDQTKVQVNPQVLFLLKLQQTSSNHFLKIAIFRYLVYLNIDQQQIAKLLLEFSNPNSLQQLRQCAVEFLQTQHYFNKQLNIVQIRLLEDQQYEIRKQTAQVLARHLKIYRFNQFVMKDEIVKLLSITDLKQLLKQNSDFHIKRKNHNQVRIFAYDKPNKFRSDINTLIDVLLLNEKINKNREQTSKSYLNQFTPEEHELDLENDYLTNILTRDEYQFEIIVRQMASCLFKNFNNPETSKKYLKLSQTHPLLQEVYKKYTKSQTHNVKA